MYFEKNNLRCKKSYLIEKSHKRVNYILKRPAFTRFFEKVVLDLQKKGTFFSKIRPLGVFRNYHTQL